MSPTQVESDGASRRRSTIGFWAIVVVLVGLDVWSKEAAFRYHRLAHGPILGRTPIEVCDAGFARVSLVREYNPGMAFGWLAGLPGVYIVIAVIRAAAVLLLLWFFKRAPPEAWLQRCSLAALVAGALGNLVDNLFNLEPGNRHAVRDFIHIAGDSWSIPTFNFADVCVTIGGTFLLLTVLCRRD